MRKLVSFMAFFAIAIVAVLAANPIVGVGTVLAIAPLATQEQVFIRSLKEEYEEIGTWLNEATDLSAYVVNGQVLKFPEGGADPEVYKDRVTDIDSTEPVESVHSEELCVYDTQNYKIRNIYLHALPFDKIQFYTKKSADAIKKAVARDAAYNLMPAEVLNNDKRIAISATGKVDSNRKSLCLDDVKTLAKIADSKSFPKNGRVLVLPSDMWWTLVDSNDILKAQIGYNQRVGIVAPDAVEYYGVKIHKSLGDEMGIRWDVSSNKKAAQDAALTQSVAPSALFFCSSEVYRADGEFKMFWKAMGNNPEGRAEEFGFQHRQKTGHQFADQKYTGVIYLPYSA